MITASEIARFKHASFLSIEPDESLRSKLEHPSVSTISYSLDKFANKVAPFVV